MYKRYLHHIWTRIRPVKPWYLAALCLLFACIGVAALRTNYTTMTKLRSAVYEADKQNGNVEEALQQLRSFVGNHMNTNLDSEHGVYPPIQLTYTYERLRKAEADRVNAINAAIYTDAQHYCEAQYPGSIVGGPRVPCIEAYIKSHPGATARTIPDAQYKFDFVSPRWSPDVAGWSLVASGFFLVLTGIRLILGRWLSTVTK